MLGVVQVASVQNDALAHALAHCGKVGVLKTLPFGDDEQGIGCVQGRHGGVGKPDVRTVVGEEGGTGFGHGHGVVGHQPGSPCHQFAHDVQAGGLAHVVGVGLEGQAPDGQRHTAQVVPECAGHQADQAVFLPGVDGFHRLHHMHGQAVLGGRAHQGAGVFGKAAAPVARACVQKAVANALVRPHAPAHAVHIGTHFIGQQGHLVHERDAGGQHGVGGVFGQLGAEHIHPHRAVVVAVEGLVQPGHQRAGPLAQRGVGQAHHDAVGPHEVFNGRAFFQEFGVGHHHKRHVALAAFIQLGLDFCRHALCSAHGHGRFVHHHLEAVHVLANLPGHGQHVLQIGRAVFRGRCAHCNEHHLGIGQRLRHGGGEAQPPGLLVALHQIVQTRLMDGHTTGLQQQHAGGVVIDPHHPVARLGQTRCRDQPHITRTHNHNVHVSTSSGKWPCSRAGMTVSRRGDDGFLKACGASALSQKLHARHTLATHGF